MEKKTVLGILLGDGSGVGPEIIVKLAANRFYDEYCSPIFIGDLRIFDRACAIVGVEVETCLIQDPSEAKWENGVYPFINRNNLRVEDAPYGELSIPCGEACIDMLIYAADLYKSGKIEGFCYAPLNKASMKEAGLKFEAELYLLAHEFNHIGPFGEINVLGNLWTTRVTSHIPISAVSKALTVESIMRAVTLAYVSFRNSGLEKPRLAIAALNPHCGEHGNVGREEIDVIAPAIEVARSQGIDISGPYSSDIVFIKAFRGEFDGVVTMYHDQGQIALKLNGFDYGITIDGGFQAPIVTCSHGTAYDIAGKNIVKTMAFENAVKMTSKMARHLAK